MSFMAQLSALTRNGHLLLALCDRNDFICVESHASQ